MQTCTTCRMQYDVSEMMCLSNEGFDDETLECEACHYDSMENLTLEICDCCGSYFGAHHLELNPNNNVPEICPFCGMVWCE